MKIEFEWQIFEGEGDELQTVIATPSARPKRRAPRWPYALILLPVLGAAIFGGYAAWVYRTQLNRATQVVGTVARSEARAIAAGDQPSFMALQDPEDAVWRAAQERLFGRLENAGIPEYGLKATGLKPQAGKVTLESDGARLDVLHQFTVTQPMPDGPASIALLVPQFYKQTPAGWVRAQPGADFWGPRRTLEGKRVVMIYARRDAEIAEPLAPHMDAVLDRACANLICPPQVTVAFETVPSAGDGGNVTAFGRSEGGVALKLLSPHLAGLPADEAARDELYRAIETRVVQGLVTSSQSGRRSRQNSVANGQLVRWHLAQAGLSGPFITPEIVNALVSSVQSGTWRPLSRVVLELRSSDAAVSSNEAMIALAFQFITERYGADAVVKLSPALATNATVGEAIRAALRVDLAALEPEWEKYLRAQAGQTPVVARPEAKVN